MFNGDNQVQKIPALLQGQKTHCAISNVYTLNTKRAKIIKIIP
jgi:hypothetical protein